MYGKKGYKRLAVLLALLITVVFVSYTVLPVAPVFAGTTYTNGSISYTRSWFGNTYGGANEKWVQNYIQQMVTTSDGTCYTQSDWDEGGRYYGIYKDGDVIGNQDMGINGKAVTISGVTWSIESGNVIKGGSKRITDVVQPTALAVSTDGKLMVAENGPRKQILFYNVTGTPVLDHTFGENGGIGAGTPGVVTPTKFWGLAGIGMDSSGNIYVALNPGNDVQSSCIRKLTPSGQLVWEVRDDIFMDVASADPTTDGLDLYGIEEHYKMDYSKTAPGTEATLYAYTLDEVKYPRDPRLHLQAGEVHGQTSPVIRYMNGRKFMFITGSFEKGIAIYRFDGEIAVPAGFIASHDIDSNTDTWPPSQPSSGRWIWRDNNGDGDIQSSEYISADGVEEYPWAWYVDSNGNVWYGNENGSITRYNYQGVNSYGVPLYDRAHITTYSTNVFSQLERLQYLPETDTMYLAGYTSARPKTGREWGMVGREIRRYDNWSTSRTLHAGYPIVLPYECDPNEPDPQSTQDFEKRIVVKAMCIEKDRIFCAYFTKGPEGISQTQLSERGEIRVYDSNSGAYLGTMIPGTEVGNFVGWVDFPDAIQAIQRSNGEYEVFVEEDGRGKVLLYRMAGTIASTPTPTATSTPGSTATPTPVPTPTPTPAAGGSLTGSVSTSSASVNLTATGTTDWAHWYGYDHKAGGGSKISNYTLVGSGTVSNYTDDPRQMAWSDGTPTASGSNNNGIYIAGQNKGFSISVPADTSTRTIKVYVGGWSSGATLTAHLSDGSAADYTNTTTKASDSYDKVYTLVFKAGSAGQTLNIKWVQSTSGTGNVTLQGAALY